MVLRKLLRLSKFFVVGLIFFIVYILFYKIVYFINYTESKSHWKNKFHDENFIEINNPIKKKISVFTDFDELGNYNTNSEYVEQELIIEKERRRKFDFYIYMKQLKVSSSQKRMLTKNGKIIANITELNSNWSISTFGPSNPHIIQCVNCNIEDELPEIGNGYIGHRARSNVFQIIDLYSGMGAKSHRSNIPAWNLREIEIVKDGSKDVDNIILGTRLDIDMSIGLLRYMTYTKSAIIQQKIYAHRVYHNLLVHEIEIDHHESGEDVIEIDFKQDDNLMDRNNDVDFFYENLLSPNPQIKMKSLRPKSLNDFNRKGLYVIYDVVPSSLSVPKSNIVIKMTYLLAIGDNLNDLKSIFVSASEKLRDNNQLYYSHLLKWKQIWNRHSIFLWKNSSILDTSLISAQYYLMINLPITANTDSMRQQCIRTIGLGYNFIVPDILEFENEGMCDYNDDLWMTVYPKLFFPQLFRDIILHKFQSPNFLSSNADFFKYKGYRIPIFSKGDGKEILRDQKYQHVHFVTGMAAISLKHYLLTTYDKQLFKNETILNYLMLINDYYVSTLKNAIPISNLMFQSIGPSNGLSSVTNSAFNLGLIKEVLEIISTLYHYFDIKPTDDYAKYLNTLSEVSSKITIPYDSHFQYNPPYHNFLTDDDNITLPEGVMLRFPPLDNVVHFDLGRSNFGVYHKRLREPLSAMVLSTLYISAVEFEFEEEAHGFFKRLQNFSNNHFKKWVAIITESNIDEKHVKYHYKGTYLPSASSYISSVLYGLLGIRIKRTGLYIQPSVQLLYPFHPVNSNNNNNNNSDMNKSQEELYNQPIRILVPCIHYHLYCIRIQVEPSDDALILKLISPSSDSTHPGLAVMDVDTKKVYQFDNDVKLSLRVHVVIKRIKVTNQTNNN